MAASSDQFHESPDMLHQSTKDRHRGIVSLSEELEAIDWYDQRIDATGDVELQRILIHNRDEEKEHAAMLVEWLRRQDPAWDAQLRTHLFTEGSIREEAVGGSDQTTADRGRLGDLGIGPLSDKELL